MRIAQIAPLFESVPPKFYGGTERVVDNLARGLIAAGHDVTVFCSGDSTTQAHAKAIWPVALRLSRKKIIDPLTYQMRMLEAVARDAREFDIIHNHYDYPLLSLRRMTQTPVITTFHQRLDLPDLPAIMTQHRDAPLVSISDSQRAPLAWLNWIRTILHGIDLAALPFREQNSGKYLVYLGRFSPEKRPDWAIEIALRSGIPLKIAAKIDENLPEYYKTVIKPRIDGRQIEYVGEINEREKAELLGNALALVNPIDWPEPFGLVMVEAMACGTPVLARPVGSVPEILVDGVTGFVRSSIDELATLAPTAARLNRYRIRHYVEERFSIERMTREYLNVYAELIAGQGPRRQGGSGHGIRPVEVRHKSADARGMAHDRWNFLHSIDSTSNGNIEGLA